MLLTPLSHRALVRGLRRAVLDGARPGGRRQRAAVVTFWAGRPGVRRTGLDIALPCWFGRSGSGRIAGIRAGVRPDGGVPELRHRADDLPERVFYSIHSLPRSGSSSAASPRLHDRRLPPPSSAWATSDQLAQPWVRGGQRPLVGGPGPAPVKTNTIDPIRENDDYKDQLQSSSPPACPAITSRSPGDGRHQMGRRRGRPPSRASARSRSTSWSTRRWARAFHNDEVHALSIRRRRPRSGLLSRG